MPTRRELMDRAEARLRARGGEEGTLEASRCFLRAMLASVDEHQVVPDALVQRVSEFLKLDLDDLVVPPVSRRSVRPTSSFPSPADRPRRVLFLGRGDAARLPMVEGIARSVLGDEVDVRAASLGPVAFDPRALRALRHAGYPTDGLIPRAVTVDDLSWADLVVTVGGEGDDWDRFLPRSLAHEHEPLEDPVQLARGLAGTQDEHEPFRAVLRSIERLVATLRPPRSSRMPVSKPAPPMSSRVPSIAPRAPSVPPPSNAPPPSVRRR